MSNQANQIENIQKSIELVATTLENIQRQINELKVPPAPEMEKWEPKGGEFFVNVSGTISNYRSANSTRLFGIERQTKELAERAVKEMRIHNRLLAYRDEFCPEYEPDWDNFSQGKYFIFFDNDKGEYSAETRSYTKHIGVVHFPKNIAKDLVDKLNSGEVVL